MGRIVFFLACLAFGLALGAACADRYESAKSGSSNYAHFGAFKYYDIYVETTLSYKELCDMVSDSSNGNTPRYNDVARCHTLQAGAYTTFTFVMVALFFLFLSCVMMIRRVCRKTAIISVNVFTSFAISAVALLCATLCWGVSVNNILISMFATADYNSNLKFGFDESWALLLNATVISFVAISLARIHIKLSFSPVVSNLQGGYAPLPPGQAQLAYGYSNQPQPGYQVPYQGPPQGYLVPPQGYQAPPQGFQAPPQGYQVPQGFQAPPQGYQAPPQGYQAPPQGFQAPPQGFQAPPQGFQAPPQGYQAPPAYDTSPTAPLIGK